MKAQEGPVRILVAEDSPTQAEQLKHILERSGYGVTLAGNGARALALLGEHKHDLVISDIVMPELNGYELCRLIRADARLADLPVVLLTSLADTADVLEGIACGADSFISKPAGADHLLAQVARMLSDRPRPDDAGSSGKADAVRDGNKPTSAADQKRMVTLLISTYEAAVRKNDELSRTQEELRALNDRLEELVAERTAALSQESAVRKQTEETLRESEKRLKELMFSSADWVWEVDERGRYTFSSEKGYEYFGKDIIGKTPFDFMSPDEAARIAAIFAERVVDKAPIKDLENWNVGENGESICFLTNGVPMLDEQGNLKGYRGVDKDITERKRLEQVLRASEVRYRRLFESAKDGILILDAESGIVVDANPFLSDLLGYSHEEVLGKALWELGFIKDTIANQDNFRELQRREYIRYENLPMETADGRRIEVEFVSNSYLVDGKPVIQCNIRDITERRRAEARIAEQMDELSRWQEATLGREGRVLELKNEINDLLVRFGEPIRYPSAAEERET